VPIVSGKVLVGANIYESSVVVVFKVKWLRKLERKGLEAVEKDGGGLGRRCLKNS
jgi:hypothetical protein